MCQLVDGGAVAVVPRCLVADPVVAALVIFHVSNCTGGKGCSRLCMGGRGKLASGWYAFQDAVLGLVTRCSGNA